MDSILSNSRREESQEDEESTLTVKLSTGLVGLGAPLRPPELATQGLEYAGTGVFGPEEDVPPELAGHFEFLNEASEEEDKPSEMFFRPFVGAHDPLQEQMRALVQDSNAEED